MIGAERQSLFLGHRAAICRFARRISPNVEDADDMLQYVAVVVFGHRTAPRDPALFVGWCCVVARNLAAHKHRSQARRRREVAQMDLDTDESGHDDPESCAIARDRLATRLGRLNAGSLDCPP